VFDIELSRQTLSPNIACEALGEIMFAKRTIYFIVPLAFFAASIPIQRGYSQVTEQHIVRIAELEIDPNQLTAYKAALKEEIETSIRVEPGVLALYAVSVKDHPNQIRLFESYSSQSAYTSHLQTAHFRKYKSETQTMVKSLTLIETDPILLGSKSK
jgi:quinol monooxygenase YgiN